MNVYNMYMSVEFFGHSNRNLVKLLLMKNERQCIAVFLKTNVFAVYMAAGNALGIWICGCRLHPGELWVSKQQVQIVLKASKSAGAKGDVPKICRFVHPLHPC